MSLPGVRDGEGGAGSAAPRAARLHLRPDALQGLVLAAQLGSVRRAARMLGLSQPGLSKLLHELEAQFGTPLLVRSFRGVAPTPQGSALIGPARRICEELEQLRQSIRANPGPRKDCGGTGH
ncbi:LysR family transcriptional regulator [Thiomonas sp. FB-6]|uniref:LysR family transcriptional regulator n=1 Tax=Thiomonas sp. FB-6 TaxID=1158291 RepID=UPI000380F097|nr:LysR family transcriptional regulator [Thiomonas sp. FB-6]